MTEIKGLGGAPGCAYGNAVVYHGGELSFERMPVSNPAAEAEILEQGRLTYYKILVGLTEEAREAHGAEGSAIFEAYQEIIQDDVFFSEVKAIILNESVCASYAIEQKRAEVEAVFGAVDDVYLQARAADINNVCRELMGVLQGVESGDPFLTHQGDRLIIFAEDLTPADTVRLDRKRLAGMVTERGGVTSHTVILAKALGIPAVVGCGAMLGRVSQDEAVLVDGEAGSVILSPDAAKLAEFEETSGRQAKLKALYDTSALEPAVTRDGGSVRVNVNSGDQESVASFRAELCDGVGLFRTEFLYMGQTAYPSEEMQFSVYKDMAERTQGKEFIIRTLDIGGDKQLDYMELPVESNPFLGYRAIRLCLDRREVFKIQLRAILRASAFGDVKIMFPMIVNLEELEQAKELVRICMEELEAEGKPFNRAIPMGIMIETPAAALLSDVLAQNCDFFSIGSNDLIQYTTATDRMNERVQYLYDDCNVSVLRTIQMVCENAHAAGIPVGICGETASEPRLVPLWCALGIDELSVAPALVGRTKYIVSQVSKREVRDKTKDLLSSGRIAEVKKSLNEILEEIGL